VSVSALLPGALGAALLVPTLTLPVVPPGGQAAVVIAQAAPRAPAARDEGRVSAAPPAPPAPPREPTPARIVAVTPTPQLVHRVPPPRAVDATPKSESEAVRRYNYEEDFVEGDIARPDGVGIGGAPPSAKHPSLIEIPREFVREIGKMIEDI